MDDDRLVSELDRRARSASPRSDWVSRDLLPAVQREIDTRPAPVITSRWPSLAGVAALVVALLILVIAVPRLAPQPPSSSASPSETPSLAQVDVLSTAEFVAQLSGGSLGGKTVLVEAAIEAFDGRGPACGLPPSSCVYGQLVSDADPPIIIHAQRFAVREQDDHATFSGDAVKWSYWSGPDQPAVGTLAISVTAEYGTAVLLGAVTPRQGDAVWSVADASAVDVGSFDLESVLLVDGWLTGVDAVLRCSPPAHQGIDGLPSNDWCLRGAWLTGDATQLDPSSFDIPADAIRVQSGAFDDFAPQPGLRDGREVVPQHGTYAIARRLFGGGRSEAPPFWAWAIVGRLSQPAPDVPPPTPRLSTALTCIGDAARPITIEDETGLVAGCRVVPLGPDEWLPQPPTVSNPDGDLRTLRVAWGTTGCVRSGSARMSGPQDGRYSIALTGDLIADDCEGPPIFIGFELDLLANVDATFVTAQLSDASPSPTPATTPPGVSIECPPTWRMSDATGAHAAVVDQTGLVTGCVHPDETLIEWSEGHPMDVGNPDGDTTALEIVWAGSPCDAAREYVLRREGDGYVLEGRSLASGACILPLVIHTIQLTLNAPIDATSVALSWNDSPPPTPTPSPMEPGTQTFACGSDSDGSDMTFIDHSGLIVSCTAREPDQPDGSPIAVTSVDGQQLIVTWPIKDSACALGAADLEFWGPLTHSEEWMEATLPNFVLRVARFSPTSCDGNARAQSVELVLNAPVPADDIEAFVSDLGLGGGNFSKVSAVTGAGSFELSLGGGNWDWKAGEPIAITAGLLYKGGADTVTLSGYGLFLGIEQLDGTLEVPPPPVTLICRPASHSLRFGVDDLADFRVFQGAGNEQYSEYFEQYGYDDQFRLPPGTYRLYAAVGFMVGPDCHGELVQLRTSVVVHVR